MASNMFNFLSGYKVNNNPSGGNTSDAKYGDLNKYTTAGTNQLDFLQNNINSLVGQTPGANQGIYNQLMEGYNTSPAAQYQMQKMMALNRNANAAQGTAGSGYNRMDDLNAMQQIMSGDQQQYYNNRLGLYNTGLGVSQHMMGQGLNAANSVLSGKQFDEQLAEQKRQFDEQQAANNLGFWGSLAQYGPAALGNYIAPGIGGAIGEMGSQYLRNKFANKCSNTGHNIGKV